MNRTTPSHRSSRLDLHAWGLVAIFALAAALRLYHLAGVPSELIADEIRHYDNAYSIVTTGRDIDGKLLPFLYSSFTRNPPMYAIVGFASTLAFGKNPVAYRLPAALMGLVAVWLVYLIALAATKRRDVALAAALVQATSPIFVHFSRIAWEPATELPFLLGGLYLLLRPGTRALYGAGVLLALTCYTYMGAWFYAVVLGGGLLLLQHRRFAAPRERAHLAWALLLWALIAAPAFWMLFGDGETYARTQRMATFGSGVTLASVGTFVQNYLAHFRWSYLVTTGDPQTGTTWRYLVGFGAFYWWVVVLAAIGLFATRTYVTDVATRRWIYLWLLAYPLGGALTTDGVPSAPRTLAGAPVFCILAALGFAAIVDRLRIARRPLVALFAANALLSVVLFSSYYFTRYVHVYPNAWGSGSRATFEYVRDHRAGYARVCFSLYPAFYEIDTYVRYYLDDVPLSKIETIDAPPCYEPGTLLVVDTSAPFSRHGFRRLTTIDDINGLPFSAILGRPSTHERLPVPTSP